MGEGRVETNLTNMNEESAIRVVVHGALGRMGAQILVAINDQPDMCPTGAVDVAANTATVELQDGSGSIPLSTNLSDLLENTDVIVDVTNAVSAAVTTG